MKEYGKRKFIPGQVIWLKIDTSDLDGYITDKRPYLIIAANNRRLVLLRMTHGGKFASNWGYSLEEDDNKCSNIICDCPITVNVHKIIETYEHGEFFSHDLFMEIFDRYLKAMIYQSVPDYFDTDEYINDVKDGVKNHKDEFLSYSKFSIRYDNGEDEEETAVEDEEEDVDIRAAVVPVDSGSNEKEDTKVTDTGSKIIEVTHKLGSVRPGEEANKVGKKSGYSRKGCHYRRLEPERDYILATDCFIYNKGWTKSDAISIQLAKLGLKNSKFIMDDLKNRNKVVYMNNAYNVTLKSSLIVNKSRTTSNAKDYAREIIADCEKVGFERAGLIWGRGTEFMRKNYWKFKKVNENVG